MPSITPCYDFQDKYSSADIETLQKMHTKQLLKERNRLYNLSEFCGDCCCRDEQCATCIQNQEYNMSQVKAILATREHVPNKKESKSLRKEKIKRGR